MAFKEDHLDGDLTGDHGACEEVFAGVDLGGPFHQLCIGDVAGRVLLQQRIIHDVEGLTVLAIRFASFSENVRNTIER